MTSVKLLYRREFISNWPQVTIYPSNSRNVFSQKNISIIPKRMYARRNYPTFNRKSPPSKSTQNTSSSVDSNSSSIPVTATPTSTIPIITKKDPIDYEFNLHPLISPSQSGDSDSISSTLATSKLSSLAAEELKFTLMALWKQSCSGEISASGKIPPTQPSIIVLKCPSEGSTAHLSQMVRTELTAINEALSSSKKQTAEHGDSSGFVLFRVGFSDLFNAIQSRQVNAALDDTFDSDSDEMDDDSDTEEDEEDGEEESAQNMFSSKGGIQFRIQSFPIPNNSNNNNNNLKTNPAFDKTPTVNLTDILQNVSNSFGGGAGGSSTSGRFKSYRSVINSLLDECNSVLECHQKNTGMKEKLVLLFEDVAAVDDLRLFLHLLASDMVKRKADYICIVPNIPLVQAKSLNKSRNKDTDDGDAENYQLESDDDSLSLKCQVYTINVPPPLSVEESTKVSNDRRFQHNLALLQSGQFATAIRKEDIEKDSELRNSMQTSMWSRSEAERLARLACGIMASHSPQNTNDPIAPQHLRKAINLLQGSKQLSHQSASRTEKLQMLLKERNVKLDSYEKRLLPAVILPPKGTAIGSSDLTLFQNVILPDKTKQIIHDLIALPILKPHFFSTGILRNSVSGCLLFGAPGTGKTLLARAIASESKATFMNITPSTIFNMYVGEAEKNVRAVFSLARKLAPTILFVDEVDSLFASRNHAGFNSKREVINEFMMEWDGIKSEGSNNGVLVVGATNRPFDLDDAVLRRLPRRILVDLPTPQERLAILKHLLRDDKVDPDALNQVSDMTNWFSGSDLKNMSIFAVLEAKKQGMDVVNIEHFKQALSEIGASIGSDDASALESLERLRKWNRSFGSTQKNVVKKLGFIQ